MFKKDSNVVRIKFWLAQDLLASCPGNTDLLKTWIQDKAKPPITEDVREEEMEALLELPEKQMTVFPRDEEGNPLMWNYQIKGFFKEACKALRRCQGTECTKLVSHLSVIDNLVFVKGIDYERSTRKIRIFMPEGATIERLVRPIRITDAKGTRVCLSASETVPEGSYFTCDIKVPILKADPDAKGAKRADLRVCFKEWLDYGEDKGLLQWRSAGWGRFTYEVID